jgi:hypothetical protein
MKSRGAGYGNRTRLTGLGSERLTPFLASARRCQSGGPDASPDLRQPFAAIASAIARRVYRLSSFDVLSTTPSILLEVRLRTSLVSSLVLSLGFLVATPAFAQPRDYAAEARRNVGDDASAVCAGCTWQRDASGWVAKAAPVSQVLTSNPEIPDGCDNVNAYARPDEALACVLATMDKMPRPSLPTFEAGKRYTHPYGDEMIVLSVGMTLEGRQMVTGQKVSGAEKGRVIAFVVSEDGGLWR